MSRKRSSRRGGGRRSLSSAPHMDFSSPAARATTRAWLLCMVSAAILSLPLLGTVWPTLVVAGSWLMIRSYSRRNRS